MATLARRHGGATERPDLMGRILNGGLWPEGVVEELLGTDALLKVEEFVDEGTLVIRSEMPGIDPDEDVEIALHDGMLTITCQRREQSRTDTRSGYRSELRYGRFERTLALPPGTVEADVKASYRDGILEVRVPAEGKPAATAKIPVARS